MRWLKRTLAGALGFAAAFFLTVDVGSGNLRPWGGELPHVANLTIRGWHIDIYARKACAGGFVLGGGWPCANTATSYTLTGPATADINVPITLTLTPNGSSTVTVTPSDGGKGGTFTPATVAFNGASPVTLTYTAFQSANSPGLTISISTTNSGTLTNPAPLSVSSPNIVADGYPGFTGAGWNDFATTHTTGGAGDPFGGSNVATVTETTANSGHQLTHLVTMTANQVYEDSFYVAPGTGTRNVQLARCENTGFSSCVAGIFNPSTCVLVSDNSFGAAASNTHSFAAVTKGGLCLVTATGNVGNFTSGQVAVLLMNGTTQDYVGDGTSSLKISYGWATQ